MPVTWHRAAEDELNNVARYYMEQGGARLAAAFLDEVQRVANLVSTRPETRSVVHDGLRRWHLRKYPYAIWYRVKGDTTRILAVAGDKQRPFFWTGRK